MDWESVLAGLRFTEWMMFTKILKHNLHFQKILFPESLISLGYPDEVVKAEERFKQDNIHHNKW